MKKIKKEKAQIDQIMLKKPIILIQIIAEKKKKAKEVVYQKKNLK